MVYTHLPTHTNHCRVWYGMLVMCCFLGLPAGLCSRCIVAVGSVQCLIFRTCRHSRSISEVLNVHGVVSVSEGVESVSAC